VTETAGVKDLWMNSVIGRYNADTLAVSSVHQKGIHSNLEINSVHQNVQCP
jgi:hypothetical protein